MAAMLFLIGRLGYLMLLRADYYSEKAQDLHERERSIKAVSYTHLDVYKRQAYTWTAR